MSFRSAAWAWAHSELKPMARLTLLSLADRADSDDICWPKVSVIAKDANISERSVAAALAELAAAGLIAITHQYREDGSLRASLYRLLIPGATATAQSIASKVAPVPSAPRAVPTAPLAPYPSAPRAVPTAPRAEQEPRNRTNTEMNRSIEPDAAPSLTTRARKGISLAPLADAFRAAGLKSPVFTQSEIGSAQFLLELHSSVDIVLCWHEIEIGTWGDQYSRDNLSFRLLASNNRVANWKRQREGIGTDHGKASTGTGSESGGTTTADTGQRVARGGPEHARFVRPRLPR